ATGTYTYSVRPAINDRLRSPVSSAAGNLMDENSNATTAELGTATYGGDIHAAPLPINNGPSFFPPFSQDTLPLIIPGPHVASTHVPNTAITPDNLVLDNTANTIDVVFDR